MPNPAACDTLHGELHTPMLDGACRSPAAARAAGTTTSARPTGGKETIRWNSRTYNLRRKGAVDYVGRWRLPPDQYSRTRHPGTGLALSYHALVLAHERR